MNGRRAKDFLFKSSISHCELYHHRYSKVCFVDVDVETDTDSEADSDKENNYENSRLNDGEAKLLKELMKWKGKAKDAQARNEQLEKDSLSFGGDDAALAANCIINSKNDEIEQLKGIISRAEASKNNEVISNQFNSSEFIKNRSVLSSQLTQSIFGSHFDFENGEIVAYDKPIGEECRMPIVNKSNEPLGFEESIERIMIGHPDSNGFIRTKMKSGSGSSPGIFNTSEGSSPHKELSGTEKIKYGLSKI